MSGPKFIPYDEAKGLELQVPGMAANEVLVEHVAPIQGRSGASWARNNALTFQFEPSAGRWLSPKECRLLVTMRIAGTAANGQLPMQTPISPAPLAPYMMFQSASCSVAGTTVETHSDGLGQRAALWFRQKPYSWQVSHGSALGWCPVRGKALAPNGGDVVLNTVSAGAPELREQFGTNGGRETTEHTFALPLGAFFSLFNGDWELPGGRIELRFQIAQLERLLIASQSGNDFDALAVATINGSDFSVAAPAGSVNLAVSDIRCAFVTHDYGASGRLDDGNIAVPLSVTSASFHELAAGSSKHSMQVSIPPTSWRISAALQYTDADTGASNNISSPAWFHTTDTVANDADQSKMTDVSAGFPPDPDNTTGNTLGAQRVAFTVAGKTSPIEYYAVQYGLQAANVMRIYNEWVATLNHHDPEPMLTWLSRGPIYSYQSANVRPADDMTSSIKVDIDRGAVVTGGNRVIMFTESTAVLLLTIRGGEVVEAAVRQR